MGQAAGTGLCGSPARRGLAVFARAPIPPAPSGLAGLGRLVAGLGGDRLALAACGAACVAARKYWPQHSAGLVQVVGRVSLSPKHSIFLVRAGSGRFSSAPASGSSRALGELGDDGAVEAPAEASPAFRPRAAAARRVDIRLGEEE